MAAIVAQKVKKNRLNTGSTPRQSGVAKDPVKLTIVNGVVQEASGGQYPDKKKGDKAAHPHSDYYRKVEKERNDYSRVFRRECMFI